MLDPFSEERLQLLSDVASAQLQARRSLDKARALQEQITMERGIWARERSQLLKKVAVAEDEILKTSKKNSVTQKDSIELAAVTSQFSSSLPATPRVLSTTSRSSISTSSLDLETAVMRYKASEAECQRLRSRIEVLEKRLREKISTVTDKTTTTTTTQHNSTKNAVGSSSTIKRSAILSTPKSTTTPSTIDSTAASELLARVIDAERSKQEAIELLRDVTNEAKKQSQEVKRLTEKINQYEATTNNTNTNTSMPTAPFADSVETKTPVRMPAQPPLPPPPAIVSAIALPYTPRRAAAHISQSFSSRINAATLATTPRLSSTAAKSLPIFSTPKRTSNSGTNSKPLFISKSPAAAKIPSTCARAKALEYASTRVPNPIVLSASRDTSGVFSSAVAAMKSTLNSSTSKDRANMHEEMTKNEQLQRFKTHEQRRSNVQEVMSSMPPPLPANELHKLEQEAIKSASSIRVTSFEMKPRSTTTDGFPVPSWLAKLPQTNISAGATITAITRDGGSSGSERHFEAF
jgi:hypothetical protein